MENYKPNPINTSDIVLSSDLEELVELLAENSHEVWAFNRMQEGWTYGSTRDDSLKQTPCMCHYNDLPDNEKTYDRNSAIETIKVLIKLGYTVKKA